MLDVTKVLPKMRFAGAFRSNPHDAANNMDGDDYLDGDLSANSADAATAKNYFHRCWNAPL